MKRLLVIAAIAAAGIYSVWGCGGSTIEPTDIVVPDQGTICDKAINQCGIGIYGSIDQCEDKFASLRVTSACAEGLKTASCDDLSNPTSAIQQQCFPPCENGGTYSCIYGGRAVTECQQQTYDSDAGILYTYDCSGICKLKGASDYSGVCGTDYQDQHADHDVCWCVY